jgi:glycerol-3-phosphate dehydrogenase subunit B
VAVTAPASTAQVPAAGAGTGTGRPQADLLVGDVLVIGGGMAGAVAALAARAAGSRVVLARRAPGATALSSGAIGVAPAEPGPPPLSAQEAAGRSAARQPSHPYAAVGPGLRRLDEALDFAAAQLPALLAPPAPRPLLLATPQGEVMACALAQRTMVAGDLASGAGPVAVVGFRGHLGFDAAWVAGAISRFTPAVPVELDLFMREEDAVAGPFALARAWEAEGMAEQAGEQLRRSLPPGTAVALFPPVLGIAPARRVAERIAAVAGVPVAETTGGVPSVPGLRLQNALGARLAEAGVTVLQGRVTEAAGPDQPATVAGQRVRAGAWVLATGRFIGGGIVRQGSLAEALLGLPVAVPTPLHAGLAGPDLPRRAPAVLTDRDPSAPQPLLSAGLRVDAALRPLGPTGAPAHPRLYAAGAVIGGHEPPADGTGLGAAILTGYLAGLAAAKPG